MIKEKRQEAAGQKQIEKIPEFQKTLDKFVLVFKNPDFQKDFQSIKKTLDKELGQKFAKKSFEWFLKRNIVGEIEPAEAGENSPNYNFVSEYAAGKTMDPEQTTGGRILRAIEGTTDLIKYDASTNFAQVYINGGIEAGEKPRNVGLFLLNFKKEAISQATPELFKKLAEFAKANPDVKLMIELPNFDFDELEKHTNLSKKTEAQAQQKEELKLYLEGRETQKSNLEQSLGSIKAELVKIQADYSDYKGTLESDPQDKEAQELVRKTEVEIKEKTELANSLETQIAEIEREIKDAISENMAGPAQEKLKEDLIYQRIASAFNQPNFLSLAFEKENQKQVFELIQDFYDEHKDVFEGEETPVLTSALNGKDKKSMPGIGFLEMELKPDEQVTTSRFYDNLSHNVLPKMVKKALAKPLIDKEGDVSWSVFDSLEKTYPRINKQNVGSIGFIKGSDDFKELKNQVIREIPPKQPKRPEPAAKWLPGEEFKEKMFVRRATQITLARVAKWEELNAPTLKEGDEKFKQKTREFWKELAISGVFGFDKKTQRWTILNFTDSDGKTALGLLRMAGIDTSQVEYIQAGTKVEGKINIDTGDKHGLFIEDSGKTAFFDHHSYKSGRETSASKLVYEALTGLGLIEKNQALNKLIEFETQLDNFTYPEQEKYFQDSYKTIMGLERFMSFDQLVKYFESGREPIEFLSDEEIKNMGLEERSKQQKNIIDKSFENLEWMKDNGLIIYSEKYGSIAVDLEYVGQARNKEYKDKLVPAGFWAARAYGCDSYLIWNDDLQSFFISSKEPLKDSFWQGRNVRGTMWIQPPAKGERLEVKLEDILNRMTDGRFKPEGELREYLEKLEAAKETESVEYEINEQGEIMFSVRDIAPARPEGVSDALKEFKNLEAGFKRGFGEFLRQQNASKEVLDALGSQEIKAREIKGKPNSLELEIGGLKVEADLSKGTAKTKTGKEISMTKFTLRFPKELQAEVNKFIKGQGQTKARELFSAAILTGIEAGGRTPGEELSEEEKKKEEQRKKNLMTLMKGIPLLGLMSIFSILAMMFALVYWLDSQSKKMVKK